MNQLYKDGQRLKRYTEVVLQEGDILYHPAGIWHAVEATEDSISINFSLRHVSKAQIVSNALMMLLQKDEKMREPIRPGQPLHVQISETLEQAKQTLESIVPEMLTAPKIMTIPRVQVVDLDQKVGLTIGSRELKRNPLFTLTDLESVAQSKKTGF